MPTTQHINSFRRNLQRLHIEHLTTLLLQDRMGAMKTPVPEDARSLARLELARLSKQIAEAAAGAASDRVTRAHLTASKARIDRALEASLTRTIAP